MRKLKLVRAATIFTSLDILLKGQLKYFSQYFEILTISSFDKEIRAFKLRENVSHKTVTLMICTIR